MIEIERKFLVKNTDFIAESTKHYAIAQGFLNSNPDRVVRIRKTPSGGYIAVKGKSSEDGVSRFEWQKAISSIETDELLKLCEPGLIEKDRYEVSSGKHLWEVDVFKGCNKGLIIAEIELSSADERFEKPTWIGEEVTGNPRYYNSNLSSHPYQDWD